MYNNNVRCSNLLPKLKADYDRKNVNTTNSILNDQKKISARILPTLLPRYVENVNQLSP